MGMREVKKKRKKKKKKKLKGKKRKTMKKRSLKMKRIQAKANKLKKKLLNGNASILIKLFGPEVKMKLPKKNMKNFTNMIILRQHIWPPWIGFILKQKEKWILKP